MKTLSFLILLSLSFPLYSQNDLLPYHTIPDYPEEYSAGTVAARVVDGLGFRFYWATEGLREQDLQFKPSPEARSIEETLDHIYEMTLMLYNCMHKEPYYKEELSFTAKRVKVLTTLQIVSNKLKESGAEELENYRITFSNGTSFPFWNMLNGPIADCIWHCGQIVSFRRSAGNPFNSNVSLLQGKVRE